MKNLFNLNEFFKNILAYYQLYQPKYKKYESIISDFDLFYSFHLKLWRSVIIFAGFFAYIEIILC